MYSFTVLEARSPQSSYQHNRTPSKGSRGESFLVLRLLAAPDPPWLVAVELWTLPPSPVTFSSSLCVLLSLMTLFTGFRII